MTAGERALEKATKLKVAEERGRGGGGPGRFGKPQLLLRPVRGKDGSELVTVYDALHPKTLPMPFDFLSGLSRGLLVTRFHYARWTPCGGS